MRNFGDLKGMILVRVEGLEVGNDLITFHERDGRSFRMFHDQDCCESVTIEEIHGNVEDILFTPILFAEETTNSEGPSPNEFSDSWTWTFYRLQTIKGSLQIRWLGESNGYYSESVYFEEIVPDKKNQ